MSIAGILTEKEADRIEESIRLLRKRSQDRKRNSSHQEQAAF